MSDSLSTFAADKLEALEARSLRRRLTPTRRLDGVWVERDGRKLISFSCNDYMGLSQHPQVKDAAARAVERYGAGAGASRLVTGDHPLLEALEARLAALKGAEAACVFGSGYLANAGTIPTFVGPADLILVDELSHACIWTGAKLSGAMVVRFRHNDTADLERELQARRGKHGRALVVTESVFSMDGDVAPLGGIGRLCEAHDAWLMVDDAHGLGVPVEKPGRIDLAMGTLSKALGSYGGYVCATSPAIGLIKTRARTLVYTTGLPPASCAAALAALEIIEAEPERAAAPLANARRFTARLNLPPADSPITPIVLGEPETALAAAADLELQGLLVVAIRPPTVPEGTSRLRIAFSALHTPEQIDRLADAVAPWIAR